MISELAGLALPDMLDLEAYRRWNPDLARLADADLVRHYIEYGETEGRRSNALAWRTDFVALIPPAADALEIGPFNSPLLRGPNVRYFDRLTQADLIERARFLKMPAEGVPAIDFVSEACDLAVVDRTFDAVLSSHAIEHQPDLIAHLRAIERLLREGGRYFVLAPDKRYCFDHFFAPSTVAEVIQAHHERRTSHTLKSVLDAYALTTHNEPARHWANDHGTYMENVESRIREGLTAFAEANGAYMDVHAWFFTPRSLRLLVLALQSLGYTSLELERIYPTRQNANEFWFVLRKPAAFGP